MKLTAAVICVLLGQITLATAGRASVATSGNFRTGTPTPTLSISAPFTLSISTTGDLAVIVFDEWVPVSNSSENLVSIAPSGQNIAYQINGGPVQLIALSNLADNASGPISAITANDGLLLLYNPIAVTAGQTLTILPQSFTFSQNPFFNPLVPTLFNGNVFATENAGGRMSANVAVPEPTAWIMLTAGAGVLGCALRLRSRIA